MTAPYYQDELVTLYHGDCLDITEWLDADVLVTDPPYGMNLLQESGFTHCAVCRRPSRSRAGTCKDCRHIKVPDRRKTVVNDESVDARDSALLMFGDKPALVFGTWKVARPSQKCRGIVVWDKGAVTLGFGDLNLPWANSHEEIYILGPSWEAKNRSIGVLRVQGLVNGSHKRPDHPTPKPVALMERLIEGCPPGVIADPFAGSGSTLIAARNLGRKVIGVEIEEHYCEMIVKRLSQHCFDFGGAS